jgi:hypothetical protein
MADGDEDFQTISRRLAKSGRVSFGNAIILSDSSRTRVALAPFFIPRSDHTELAAKIVTYAKRPPPLDWALVEQKSISLSGEATRRLLAGLRCHLAVAEENEDGEFILIRVMESTAQLGSHDPARVAAALTKVMSQEEIVTHLQNTELTTELAAAFRSAIRLSEMRAAVLDLRTALEEGDMRNPPIKAGVENILGRLETLTLCGMRFEKFLPVTISIYCCQT